MIKPTLIVALLSSLLLAAACTSASEPTATPTPSPEPTATALTSPSAEPTPRQPFILASPTPDPDLKTLAATVWLVDLHDGAVTTIIEDYDN
ncbi:MAG: hypothetical protein HOH95_10475 [Dehalococcoidia bacterium]|nr:hypothetical protein [Dehalococcoidia bacterium]